jgi:carbamoylphosphate synthase small subunit
MPANLRVTHKSLFDGTLQGIHRTDKPAFSFQGTRKRARPARCRAAVRPLYRIN